MPSIAAVNHDKAVLSLIFMAANITDVSIEARRLDRRAIFGEPSRKPFVRTPADKLGVVQKMSISDVYASAEEKRTPGNYMYLMPSRVLLKDEWENLISTAAKILQTPALHFRSSFMLTCEDGRVFETNMDLTEDGKKPLPTYAFHHNPPQKTFF